ncbi:hypothetical protein EV424DRAFT_1372572 [Suillus variegatus]|nr:hypothetical protein EV424DRAFT_1372572 [Suillus variegatus]
MPTPHLALAADVGLDPSMGVFDFADAHSAISLAQFVLRLRTHFQDIKGAISIEAVDSLSPLRWRSDLPDFETQFGGQSDERVVSWIHEVHVQTSSSETSSSSTPRTPSLLLDTALVSYDTMASDLSMISEDEPVDVPKLFHGTRLKNTTRGGGSQPSSSKGSLKRHGRLPAKAKGSTSLCSEPYSNSRMAALPDNGLVDGLSMSNWLFERHAFTVGRIPITSKELEKTAGINEMIEKYDKMTVFCWSDAIKAELSSAALDSCLLDMRAELCATNNRPSSQSNTIVVPLSEDIQFISSRISALLHAVQGARICDTVAKLYGANKADRRHEWDSLIMNFYQPTAEQGDVLLERPLNLARNFGADDTFFSTQAIEAVDEYARLCLDQYQSVGSNDNSFKQAIAARDQANKFADDIKCCKVLTEVIGSHSSKDPVTGKCDAILVIPCPGAATTVLQHICGTSEPEKFSKSFMLVQGPKADKLDASTSQSVGHSQKITSIETKRVDDHAQLQNPFHCSPDDDKAPQEEKITDMDIYSDEPRKQDLFLPVLLAEYKKRDQSSISTAVNQTKTYLVSAVTFLSELGITDHPVFGLVVNGALGAITMAWKKNNVCVHLLLFPNELTSDAANLHNGTQCPALRHQGPFSGTAVRLCSAAPRTSRPAPPLFVRQAARDYTCEPSSL